MWARFFLGGSSARANASTASLARTWVVLPNPRAPLTVRAPGARRLVSGSLDMPLQDLRSWFAVGIAFLSPSILSAAALPVVADRFEGEVMRDVGAAVQGLVPGQSFEPGTRIRTGADGRVELSVQSVPTLKLGSRADLLLHSVDQNVLRAKLSDGALSVDTRARKGAKARDMRLNVGDLRLRIQATEAWVERNDQGSVVCLVSGLIDARIADQPVRLDTPGQCLRHSGLTSMWSMVPQSVLVDRIALTQVRAPTPSAPVPDAAVASAPLPAVMAPKAPVVVVAAPEPKPAPEPASERVPAATRVALSVPVVVQPPEVPPVPVPVVNPTMPAAGSAALGTVAAVALPEIPPEPVAVPNPRFPAVQATAVELAPAAPAPEIPVAAPVPSAEGERVGRTQAQAEAPVAPKAAEADPMTGVVAALAADARAQAQALAATQLELDPAPIAPPAEQPSRTEEPRDGDTSALASAAPAALEPSGAAETAALAAAEVPAPTPKEQPAPEVEQQGASDAAAAAALAAAAAAEPIPDDGRRWSIVLASFPLREPADKEMSRFKSMGLEAETREYRVGTRHGFRVGLGRYASREEADAALAKLVGAQPEIIGWLAKY